MTCPLFIKRIWEFKAYDFFELVAVVKKQEKRIAQLEAIVERQGNQIENAFNIFSKEGEHY